VSKQIHLRKKYRALASPAETERALQTGHANARERYSCARLAILHVPAKIRFIPVRAHHAHPFFKDKNLPCFIETTFHIFDFVPGESKNIIIEQWGLISLPWRG
jgi:hypothetical protein